MTREEAIQVIRANGLYYVPNNTPVFEMLIDAFDMAIEALKDVPDTNVGKWIPCSERLPGDNEPFEVLCCDIYGNQLIAHPYKDYRSDTDYSAECEGCIMYDCIAWMPLPEPYREEQE